MADQITVSLMTPDYGGEEGIRLGLHSSVYGSTSVAIGKEAHANRDAIALGYHAEAGGCGSVAIGNIASANGCCAIAIGPLSTAAYTNSIAVGPSAHASGCLSVAIGAGARAGSGSLSIGACACAEIDEISFGFGSNGRVTVAGRAFRRWATALNAGGSPIVPEGGRAAYSVSQEGTTDSPGLMPYYHGGHHQLYVDGVSLYDDLTHVTLTNGVADYTMALCGTSTNQRLVIMGQPLFDQDTLNERVVNKPQRIRLRYSDGSVLTTPPFYFTCFGHVAYNYQF